ncbi:glycosyltransferase [Dactylosporangium siamense]|uniref:Glycosyl transferase family 1 n=1 Tax=Dactylosporangium siamense TaxID=685454 RepID=A0A919PSW1_9ACTN|nr:glycosyltransferase [Dactylosporangium siamense]GIG50265.1 glycosyl transferase family 1 [Dactylosporangium siamense]
MNLQLPGSSQVCADHKDTPTVLHVAQPTTGGVARVIEGLVRAQTTIGYTVTVACPPGPLADAIESEGGRWARWDSTRQPGRSLIPELRALRGIIAKTEPDLVHLHSSKAGLVGRLGIRRRRPTVFQPHAWSFLASSALTRTLAIHWEQCATRWTDLTLYCSRAEQAAGQRRGVTAPGRVVLNGVDLDTFSPPSAAERTAARAELGLSDHASVAVVVGRACHQKGQDIALRSWKRVRQVFPDALLILAGEGVEALPLRGEGVCALGPRSDVRRVFLAADLVLAPSRWEGMSLSLLEGMACARSTVATDVAGNREALTQGDLPGAGAIVGTDDPVALSSAVIERFAQRDLLAAEGAAARQRIEQRFDEQATIQSIHESYQAVLDGRSAHQLPGQRRR